MLIINEIKLEFQRVNQAQSGLAYIEFALTIPLLLLMFFGAIEISRYFLIIQTVEKTIATVTDVASQSDAQLSPLTTAEVSALTTQIPVMMNPYGACSNVTVIVSDVSEDNSGTSTVNWQFSYGGLGKASQVGSVGGTPSFPATTSGFSLNPGQEVLIGEIYYSYSPIILTQNIMSPMILYRTSVYSPRYGSLATAAVSGNNPCPLS